MPRTLHAAIALVRSAVRGEARAVWGRLLVLFRERATTELGVAAANAITWAVIDNPDLWVDGEAGRWMAQTRDACIASLPRRSAGDL
ncbi:MAG: hypothetical protein U0271_38115 [Polyangiaceae bacterium]